MKVVAIIIGLSFFLCGVASAGLVVDSNNGSSGDILVNNGGGHPLGTDTGSWVNPDSYLASKPELKGAAGDTGATGAQGIQGEQGEDSNRYNEYGVKIDAPNLVKLTSNWNIGAEASKDFNHTSANEGYSAYVKATFTGNLFDFSKK